jgi:BirA family transcriptional regulator, biotin operon repressor / biotin---[acetyl-CoA-carboxylase] ligase
MHKSVWKGNKCKMQNSDDEKKYDPPQTKSSEEFCNTPYSLIVLQTIDSTNSYAKRKLNSFRDEIPTFIAANEQTGGRGRFGNSWVSPKDQNLYLTLAERVRPPLQLVHYSQAAALAMSYVLKWFGICSRLKWPNDLFVGSKKICGILVEGTSVGKIPWAVVGIGLNVNMESNLLRAIDRPATSMQEALSKTISVEEVQRKTVEITLSTIKWACQSPQLCEQTYLEACSWMKGTQAVVHTPSGAMEGKIEGFSHEGYLVLELSDGEKVSVAQGVIEKFG